MEENTQELATAENYQLVNASSMMELATKLKGFILDQKLYSNIKGREYVNVEGWQFAGGMLGILPIIKGTVNNSTETEIKYAASCDLINIHSGKVVGGAFSTCSNKESGKKQYDEYAIESMAQTRCIGKAYRLMIGWLMKAAGYESTPAEEMDSAKEQEYLINAACIEILKGHNREDIATVWAKYPQFREEQVFNTAAKAMSSLYPKEQAEKKPSDASATQDTQTPTKSQKAAQAQDRAEEKPTIEELKELYRTLLNHPTLTRQEQTKRLLLINKLDAAGLEKEIDVLTDTIYTREHEPTEQITYRNEEETV